MATYFSFDDSALPTVEQVGGKGLSLINSKKLGFRVPNAVVLPSGFFQPWMELLRGTPEWNAFKTAQNEGMMTAAKAVKDYCQNLEFTEGQHQTLAEVSQYLRAEDITMMAVRSSSPKEDLEGASFAGIYETVLGVTWDDLEGAIKTCFASALDARVVAYKVKSGFDPHDHRIAVVIQKQIASEVSGVAYSLNPISNCYDECVINANFGLGETIVDGAVTPDHFVVNKVSNEILEKTHGKKDKAVYLKPQGGTESRTPESSSELCLHDDQIRAITALASRIEAAYGKPMDIEWAFESQLLYLLQARPITSYYRLPEEMITPPGEQKYIYHDDYLSEQGLSESLSPLGTDLFMDYSASTMPGRPSEDFYTVERGMAFGSVGRMHTQLGRMIKLLGKKGALRTYKLIDDLGTRILEAMDLKEYIPRKLPKGSVRNLVRTGLGAAKYIGPLMKAKRHPDEFLQQYLSENARLRADLRAEFHRKTSFVEFRAICSSRGELHMYKTQLPALLASERARSKLKKMFGKDPESVQEHLRLAGQAFPHNVTIEMGLALFKLSRASEVRQVATAEKFVQKLDAGEVSSEFTQLWRSFMDDYGFRGPKELDAATPRYYEKPGEVFTLLKTMASRDDPDLSPRGIFDRRASRRAESVRFLEDYLTKKRPGKIKAFRKSYKLLENFAAYRESPKYYIIMIIDYYRRRVLEQGKQWMKAERLDSAEQVFYLRLDEFRRAEEDSSLDIRLLANSNRDYYARFNPNNDPPIIIDSRGFVPKLPPQQRKENELSGTPVSSGTVIGPVKVLNHPDEKPILPGDVLVTKATDPGWTTLFINAGGVLLETGGMLQHGASVAREMGKPCIVGIEDVTKILKDGQTVELNGGTGMIKMLG
jgi:rifampicin phosphotransferase